MLALLRRVALLAGPGVVLRRRLLVPPMFLAIAHVVPGGRGAIDTGARGENGPPRTSIPRVNVEGRTRQSNDHPMQWQRGRGEGVRVSENWGAAQATQNPASPHSQRLSLSACSAVSSRQISCGMTCRRARKYCKGE